MGVRLDPRAQEFRPSLSRLIQWYPPPPPPPPPPPLSATPTRSLLLSPVPPAADSALIRQLQAFGQVRGLQTEGLPHGVLTVHFFDLRHAESAFTAIRMQHWPQFPISAHYVLPEAHNQGTLLLFNLDPSLSTQHLRRLFQPFGPIKELRDTPWKKNQRFVEFFDVRDAVTAFKQMNGKEIHGKPLLIEFHSKPPPSPPPARRFPHTSKSEEEHEHENEHEHEHEPSRRNLGNKQQVPRARHWKGKQAKKHETRFLIKEDAPKDTRTTVMIKNIPNKYSQKLLLNMLDNHCIHCNEQLADDDQPRSSYDFLYLPIDFNNKCNVGYGFVNMTSPEATLRLYKAFHLQHWEVFNSRKICQVTYARVQGLEALKEHFKNSKFPCEMEHYLPVVFSPPRDGKELTEPLPIVGNKQNHAIPITPVSSGGAASDDDVASTKTGGEGDHDHLDTKEQVGGNL